MMPKSKICNKCGVEKPLDEFNRNKSKKFGRASHCKVCVAEYYGKNRERLREQERQYREENRERVRERNRQYYEENRERLLEQQRQYREENRERLREKKRQYTEANHELVLERNRQYREANHEKISEWRRQNAEKIAAFSAKRRAAKICRTPAWSDLEHIKLFYEARQAISEATGRDYHVDHEIPLQGKTVSGLHVPSNLQIIPAEHNLRKKNRF